MRASLKSGMDPTPPTPTTEAHCFHSPSMPVLILTPSHPTVCPAAPSPARGEGSVSLSAAAAKSLQLCLTLCDPINGSPPGSPIPGILQARTLEWVTISFSNAWKWKMKVKSLSHVRLLATPWTAAYQAPLSMGFSRQEYWSGVPLPYPFLVYMVLTLKTNHNSSFLPPSSKVA